MDASCELSRHREHVHVDIPLSNLNILLFAINERYVGRSFVLHIYLSAYSRTKLDTMKEEIRGDDFSKISRINWRYKRRESSTMIAPFIMEIRNKGSLIEFRATGHFVSSLIFSLTDSLLGGNGERKKEKTKRSLPVIRARTSFLDSNDSYRSQKRDWKRIKKKVHRK